MSLFNKWIIHIHKLFTRTEKSSDASEVKLLQTKERTDSSTKGITRKILSQVRLRAKIAKPKPKHVLLAEAQTALQELKVFKKEMINQTLEALEKVNIKLQALNDGTSQNESLELGPLLLETEVIFEVLIGDLIAQYKVLSPRQRIQLNSIIDGTYWKNLRKSLIEERNEIQDSFTLFRQAKKIDVSALSHVLNRVESALAMQTPEMLSHLEDPTEMIHSLTLDLELIENIIKQTASHYSELHQRAILIAERIRVMIAVLTENQNRKLMNLRKNRL